MESRVSPLLRPYLSLLIVIPAELMDVDGVNEIIREVNSTHIQPEEVLADRVFLYKKDEGWI